MQQHGCNERLPYWVSKSERERPMPYITPYVIVWNLKYDTNAPTDRTETDSHREQTCGCQRGWGGMEWEVGVNRCKLLYTEKNIKEKKSMYIHIHNFAVEKSNCKSTICQ